MQLPQGVCVLRVRDTSGASSNPSSDRHKATLKARCLRRRPILSAVPHSDDLQLIAVEAIPDDKAGAGNPGLPDVLLGDVLAGARMDGKEAFEKRVKPRLETGGGLRRVVGDQVVELGFEIMGGAKVEDNPHWPAALSFSSRRALRSA